jgi:hypothetical protein
LLIGRKGDCEVWSVECISGLGNKEDRGKELVVVVAVLRIDGKVGFGDNSCFGFAGLIMKYIKIDIEPSFSRRCTVTIPSYLSVPRTTTCCLSISTRCQYLSRIPLCTRLPSLVVVPFLQHL